VRAAEQHPLPDRDGPIFNAVGACQRRPHLPIFDLAKFRLLFDCYGSLNSLFGDKFPLIR
jgi:hypothetical protein